MTVSKYLEAYHGAGGLASMGWLQGVTVKSGAGGEKAADTSLVLETVF